MWLNSSSIDNEEDEEEEDDEYEEEEEETLSLHDLPNNEENQTRKESPCGSATQEDFDFCSFLKSSTMCGADEVFFQGQILTLHYSSSLPSDSHYTVARGQITCNEAKFLTSLRDLISALRKSLEFLASVLIDPLVHFQDRFHGTLSPFN
ncbi:hypothetical protein RND71_039831 [Anisodus tanguticus]|uniref:Uncharacterized protein n=1 Tax=Anisodus tanguticus TaxID=243964 RepID=A0AAE1QX90_9SOLA|nr:hypothetical protein RND71_039831 [Anisodus tanguticus]